MLIMVMLDKRPGKITYKEKEIVEKNIDEDLAVEALINLIKKMEIGLRRK